jgi:hypothetical protein
MSARDELARVIFDAPALIAWDNRSQWIIADAILAAGYRKPRTITTVEELDALPNGSVVLSQVYRHYLNGMDISFQRWEDGLWHRGARSSDTHPDNFLPVTVIHEPAA